MHSKGRVIEKEQESRDGPKQRDRGCYLNHQQASCISQDESFPIHYPFISFQPPLCIGFVSCEYVLREMGKRERWRTALKSSSKTPVAITLQELVFFVFVHTTQYTSISILLLLSLIPATPPDGLRRHLLLSTLTSHAQYLTFLTVLISLYIEFRRQSP